ncbi:MAG: hypothetical protein P8J37_20985 [Fuerstiella sp.]|nr:hypothetical protein [Fuerstiella sp.]
MRIYAAEHFHLRPRQSGIRHKIADDHDLYNSPDVITTGVLLYPGVTLAKGDHQLRLEITGAHPKAAKNYIVGIDYIRLVPVAKP